MHQVPLHSASKTTSLFSRMQLLLTRFSQRIIWIESIRHFPVIQTVYYSASAPRKPGFSQWASILQLFTATGPRAASQPSRARFSPSWDSPCDCRAPHTGNPELNMGLMLLGKLSSLVSLANHYFAVILLHQPTFQNIEALEKLS